MKFSQLITFFLFSVSSLVCSATVIVVDTQDYDGSTYQLIANEGNAGITWTDARDAALAMGGNLVTVNDANENLFIFNTWASASNIGGLWLGLNDVLTPNTFEWMSGESSSFTNFQPGEPNNSGGNEQYVHMWGGSIVGANTNGGQWNDAANLTQTFGKVIFGVVEIVNPVPTPPALGMLLIGLLSFGASALRRRQTAVR